MSVPRACFCKGAGMGTSSVSVDRSALKRCPCAPAGPCVSEQDPGIPGGREATTPNTLQASTPRLVPCKKKGQDVTHQLRSVSNVGLLSLHTQQRKHDHPSGLLPVSPCLMVSWSPGLQSKFVDPGNDHHLQYRHTHPCFSFDSPLVRKRPS